MAKSRYTEEELEAILNQVKEKSTMYDYRTKDYPFEVICTKYGDEDNLNATLYVPKYQREFVWKPDRQSKFIESILLGLPIPPMYFAEIDEGILEVIDGSQRIRTINRFLRDELKLKGLQRLDKLNGLTFNDFSSSRKRKINNVSMRVVVVTDLEKDTMSIRHEIFERLNTGGEILKKMEVKKGANKGKFIKFIYTNCAEDSDFNTLSQFNRQDELRAYKEEFLIKYFAFVESMSFDDYINSYLDTYLDKQNIAFQDDVVRDEYLLQFRNMVSFVKDNNLISDISINRKNRLLAIYIGTTLALKVKSSLIGAQIDKNIFTDTFIENAKSNAFYKLQKNVELVKNILLS